MAAAAGAGPRGGWPLPVRARRIRDMNPLRAGRGGGGAAALAGRGGGGAVARRYTASAWASVAALTASAALVSAAKVASAAASRRRSQSAITAASFALACSSSRRSIAVSGGRKGTTDSTEGRRVRTRSSTAASQRRGPQICCAEAVMTAQAGPRHQLVDDEAHGCSQGPGRRCRRPRAPAGAAAPAAAGRCPVVGGMQRCEHRKEPRRLHSQQLPLSARRRRRRQPARDQRERPRRRGARPHAERWPGPRRRGPLPGRAALRRCGGADGVEDRRREKVWLNSHERARGRAGARAPARGAASASSSRAWPPPPMPQLGRFAARRRRRRRAARAGAGTSKVAAHPSA